MNKKAVCHLVGAMGGTVKPELQPGDCLVAVDGGLPTVEQWGLTPDWTVGDFDSLGYTPVGKNILALPTEKDETDMGFALEKGKKLGYQGFFLQGGVGGRLDHTMGNLQLLLGLSRQGMQGILVGENQNIMVITGKTLIFPAEMSGYCSIFALGGVAGGVTMKNLAYSLQGGTLSPDIPLGVSNEFLPGKSASIQVDEGSLAIFWQGTWDYSLYRSLLTF